MTVPHLPHEMGLEMWSAVDRDGCFVKLPRSINFVPPEGYKKLIQWELSSWLLLVARASAWLSYSTWNICIHWFQSLSVQHPCLLHCCHGVSFATLFDWGFWETSILFSAMLHLCRDAGYKKLIQWELSSWLLLVARASAWLSYSTWNICIHWFQSLSVQHPCLLHCCHGVSFATLFDWGFWETSILFSAMLHLCRDAGYKTLIRWELPSWLLLVARAPAWLS